MTAVTVVALAAIGAAIGAVLVIGLARRRTLRRLRAQNTALRDAFDVLVGVVDHAPAVVADRIRWAHLLGGMPTDMFQPPPPRKDPNR